MTATGYVSAESKRVFTLTAGILGAAFFILQFISLTVAKAAK